jgi:hypothetical protein
MHETMGDLPGHLFPGLALFAWAVVWWSALARRGGPAWLHPWSVAPDEAIAADAASTAPWESWLKIVVPVVEMGFEFRWLTWPMTDASATIYGHITADVAILLSGLADRLTARGRLPAGTDRIALTLALAVVAALFAAHGQHGPVAPAAHNLFAAVLFATAALTMAEHIRPAPLFRWARIYSLALAGAWFVHTGWLLYVSGYDLMNAALVPRVWMSFIWYAIGVAVALTAAIATGRRARLATGSR